MPTSKRPSKTKRSDAKLPRIEGAYTEETMFSKLITKCGVILMDGNRPNTISIEQSKFLKKFQNGIQTHNDFPSVTAEIMKGIAQYMKDEKRFLRMMLATDLVEKDADEDIPSFPQDSVLRLLLNTPTLQTGLAEMVIDRMHQFDSKPNRDVEGVDAVHAPQLILYQLRWLNTMNDADKIALKLIDAASRMSKQVSFMIITTLPEIIGDEVHDNVMDKLSDFLSSNHSLTIPILSTISSLNCSKKYVTDIENVVFSLLHSKKLDEFPFILKYLLQTISADNADDNITRMRPHISFAMSDYSQDSENMDQSPLHVVAETILHAAQYRSVVAEAWIKILKNLNANEFTSADLITTILLSATYNSTLKKNAISVLKSKTQEGILADDLVQSAFTDSGDVLNPYFPKISNLALQFLSSNTGTNRQFGAHLYVCMFNYMDSSFRKEVIKSLVQHVSTFSASEVDSALDALQKIVLGNIDLVIPYTDIIRDMIDHMERLTSPQMRQIFGILNQLSCSDACESSELQDDLVTIVRNYATHTSTKFQCIGVIGAVNTVSILGTNEHCNSGTYKKVKLTLNLLQELIASDNRIGSYFFDELCNISFDSIQPRVKSKLYSLIEKSMSQRVLQESDDDMNLKSSFGIQKDTESVIPVYRLTRRCDSSHLVLCPIFKALYKIVSENQKDQAIVFCLLPVEFHRSVFDAKEFQMLPWTEQKLALDAMFITTNLFREHINFMCNQPSLYHHLLSRINNIIAIDVMIESLLPSLSNKYAPLVMMTDFANFAQQNSASTGGSPSTQNDSIRLNATSQSQNISESTVKKSKTKKKNETNFSIQSLKPNHFRELFAGLMKVLEKPLAEDLFEADLNVEDSLENVTLTAGQALFILLDLKRKVCYKLPARSEEKRLPFLSAVSSHGFEDLDKISEHKFGNMVCNLIPSLCNHLESVSGVFDEKRQEYLDARNRRVLIQCYESTLEVIFHGLSWRGLRSNLPLLKRVLYSIVRRFSSELTEDSLIRNLIKGCVDYLKNFKNTIAQCSLQSSVYLMKILFLLASFESNNNNQEVASILHSFSTSMLKVDWALALDQSLSAGKTNELLTCLLKMNVQTADDVLKCAAHFVDEGLCKLGAEDNSYPNFQKSNCHVLYCGLLEIMADQTCKIPALKARDEESVSIEILLKWNDCMKVISVIGKLLREYHSRPNVLSSLKSGKVIIENFIKNGMPICEKLFHLYQDDIVSTLKHLQLSTRQLQHLTCHSKVTQDVTLAKHVPPLKKCLESLLFRVKAMLTAHDCQEAFWLGNLKNRNIQGEEILSQLTQQRSSQEDPNSTPEYEEMLYSESY